MDIVRQLADIARTRPEVLKRQKEKGMKKVDYCLKILRLKDMMRVGKKKMLLKQ